MFVCLGNICRSPLAQGLFEDLAQKAGLSHHFEVTSAGIGAWHIGEKPDPRMQAMASQHGIDISNQRAQQLVSEDLSSYDYVYAMDRSVQRDILLLTRNKTSTAQLFLFSAFDPDPNTYEVPDPYFDGNFVLVYTIVERTCKAILEDLKVRHRLVASVESA